MLMTAPSLAPPLRPGAPSADATRRQFLAIIAAAGLVSACGADDPVVAPRSGSHDLQDVFGTVKVPRDPQRIVVMDQQVLGNLVALDFPLERVVGFAAEGIGPGDLDYLDAAEDIARFKDVGAYDKPNAEAILALEPDLILIVADKGYDDFYGPIFKTLELAGAPVFSAFNGYVTLADSMRLLHDVARAVGREDKAEKLEKEFRAEITELAEDVAAAGPLPSAGFLRSTTDGLFFNNTMPLLDELKLPGKRPTPKQFYIELSAEELGQFDHDVLFVSDGDDRARVRKALEGNPLWKTLPAVEADRAHFVSDLLWGTSYSLPAYREQLAAIRSALLA